VGAGELAAGIGPPVLWILLGALLAVEQVAFAQLQLAHSFVAGGLAGLLAGDPFLGALLGGVLGLLVCGHRPVGGVIPPDGGIGAVIGVLVWKLAPEPSGRALLLALGAALVTADLGRHTEAWTRRRNLGFLRAAEAEATPGAIRRAVGLALALGLLRGGLTVAIGLVLAPLVLGRLEPGGPAPVAILALLCGVGLAAEERLLGARKGRGLLLALGAALAVLGFIPGGLAGLAGGGR
jgi:hypothetical protein